MLEQFNGKMDKEWDSLKKPIEQLSGKQWDNETNSLPTHWTNSNIHRIKCLNH